MAEFSLQNARAVSGTNPPRARLQVEAGQNITIALTDSAENHTLTAQFSSDAAPGQGAAKPLTILSNSTQVVNADGVVVVATTVLNPSDYHGTTRKFQAVLSSAGSWTTRVRLYDPGTGVYITSGSLSTTSTTPQALISDSLTLSDSLKVYEIHADVTGASNSSDAGIVYFAGFRITSV